MTPLVAPQPLDIFLRGRAPDDVAAVFAAIEQGVAEVGALISGGPLRGALGRTLEAANADGDTQRSLDITADTLFRDALRAAGVRAMISEEAQHAVPLNPQGRLSVAIDPLDGSSNIDTNVSIGTIFSVLAAEGGELQAGHAQIAAGFVIYGPHTALVFTVGEGAHIATLDPATRRFFVTRIAASVPQGATEFAINASNYRHWRPPVQAYFDDLIEGAEGPRGKNFNMRWIASLVADAYRIIVRGGVFLYPADGRKGYERGRLRLVYEANPIAFVMEQAGAAATDGVNRILDLAPGAIHARTPLVFGSIDKVERVRRYHLETEFSADRSPLFGRRGLLRV